MQVNTPGVVATTTSNYKTGPSKTVSAIFEMKQYIVTFYDEQGNEHTDVLIRIGDKMYASRNGEAWCAGLAPAVSWLSDIVRSRIASKVGETFVPEASKVNVTGSQIAEETKKILEGR